MLHLGLLYHETKLFAQQKVMNRIMEDTDEERENETLFRMMTDLFINYFTCFNLIICMLFSTGHFCLINSVSVTDFISWQNNGFDFDTISPMHELLLQRKQVWHAPYQC